jgi:hypothetical protein
MVFEAKTLSNVPLISCVAWATANTKGALCGTRVIARTPSGLSSKNQFLMDPARAVADLAQNAHS